MSFALIQEIQNKERNALYAILNTAHDEELFKQRNSNNVNDIALTQVKFLLHKARYHRREFDRGICSIDTSDAALTLVVLERRSREVENRENPLKFV